MKRPRLVRVYKNLKSGGGVQSRLLELLPRLGAHLEIRVLCYRDKGDRAGELEAAGIPVDVIPTGSKWAPWNVARYTGYFRRVRPQLVHTHEYTANTLAISAAARAGVPVRVRHLHSLAAWGWGNRLRTLARVHTDRVAARRSRVTLAVSEAVREEYLGRTGLPPESCRVLYNGIDLERFEGCKGAGARVRGEWNVPRGVPLVGIVGRLSRGKGHREFLLAARAFADRVPSARFAVVGEGGSRGELEELCAGLGLADRVVFAGHRADVPACLGAMDLFLFSSIPDAAGRVQDGLPATPIEAMAAGLPVVAFRLPMMEEILGHGVSGVLVPPGDVEAMAAAAEELWRDRARSETLARAARQKAGVFSLEACVENTLRLYEELLSEGDPP